jgi:hypothetical protein
MVVVQSKNDETLYAIPSETDERFTEYPTPRFDEDGCAEDWAKMAMDAIEYGSVKDFDGNGAIDADERTDCAILQFPASGSSRAGQTQTAMAKCDMALSPRQRLQSAPTSSSPASEYSLVPLAAAVVVQSENDETLYAIPSEGDERFLEHASSIGGLHGNGTMTNQTKEEAVAPNNRKPNKEHRHLPWQ